MVKKKKKKNSHAYNLKRFKVNHMGSICCGNLWLLFPLGPDQFICHPAGLWRQPELRTATGSRSEVGPDTH